jgi:xylulokinase
LIEGFLIIDFSTRNVQSNLINIENGQLLDSRVSTYSWFHENPDWSEIKLDDIWSAAQKVVSEIIENNKEKCEIAALGFSWFGDNLLLTNANGDPLENLILSFDYRAKEEAQKLIDEFGEEKLFDLVGNQPINAGLIPAKILWLQRHKPNLISSGTYLLNLQQYILQKLGLGIITDYSMAYRKNLFDIKNQCWSNSLCDYLKISIDQLGKEIFPANKIIGSIKKFGNVNLPKEIPVQLGTHNSTSGMIGLGSVPEISPVLTEVIGTFNVIGLLSNTYFEKFTGFFSCYCGPFKDTFVIAGSTIAQTDLDWGMKTLYEEEKVSSISDMLKHCALDGGNNVIMAKGIQTGNGVIRGLNLSSTKNDIFQAIIEGVTFPLIGIISQLSKVTDRKFKSIRCGGRGALDDRYLQMKSDMYNLSVEKTKNTYASSLGAAIMLAVELGYSPNYEAALKQMISIEKVFEPRREISDRYKERYLEYLGHAG